MTVHRFPGHQGGVEGLGADGKDIVMTGGTYPGVINILSGSGTSCNYVCIRVTVHVGFNHNNGGGISCRIPKVDHGEEGTENHRWEMGDTGVWRVVEGE